MKTIVEMQPINRELNIYLAEDDEADCLLLKKLLMSYRIRYLP
jgi:hypothetical protein